MKVLLDENLDHALRTMLGRHEVVTAAYMGWAGMNNGELLRIAEDNGVQVLLTGDQTLNHEQNLSGRNLAVVALSAIQLPIIKRALSRNLTGGLFGGSSAVWAFLTRTTVFPRAGTAESAPELTSWVQVIPEPSTIFAGKLG